MSLRLHRRSSEARNLLDGWQEKLARLAAQHRCIEPAKCVGLFLNSQIKMQRAQLAQACRSGLRRL